MYMNTVVWKIYCILTSQCLNQGCDLLGSYNLLLTCDTKTLLLAAISGKILNLSLILDQTFSFLAHKSLCFWEKNWHAKEKKRRKQKIIPWEIIASVNSRDLEWQKERDKPSSAEKSAWRTTLQFINCTRIAYDTCLCKYTLVYVHV